MNKSTFLVASGLGAICLIFSFQNCSQGGFASTELPSQVKINPEHIVESPNASVPAAPQVPDSKSDQNQTSPTANVGKQNSACGCDFNLKAYLDRGFTTTFYYDGKAITSPDAKGNMSLPGVMKDYFTMQDAQQNLIYFQCSKGMLDLLNNKLQLTSRSPAVSASCAINECKFKLPQGAKTRFIYIAGKIYEPDVSGNMILPANMGAVNFDVLLPSGEENHYSCGKGAILSRFNSGFQLIEQGAGY